MLIRNYRESDFQSIARWWDAADETAPIPTMLPTDSTFVLEIDSIPVLCITVYTTNSNEVAFLENFVGNPTFKGPKRRDAAQILVSYACDWAKERGINRVICFAYKEPLVKRYQELGMRKTMTNITSFVKEL